MTQHASRMTQTRTTNGIRPLTEADLPQVVKLSMKLFPRSGKVSFETQYDAFRTLCLDNPWYDASMSSLVYEKSDGRIIGFVGVVPRRMSLDGKTIHMAVSQHLMVDPDSRSSLAGVQLLKAVLAGPQDLSIADVGGDTSRRIWERIGGSVSILYSIYWVRPLRPVRFVLQKMARRRAIRPLAHLATPFGGLMDSLLARVPDTPFHRAAPQASGEELTVDTLLEGLSQSASLYRLYPDYDRHALDWLLTLTAREKRYGALQKVMVRDKTGRMLGWYLYYLSKEGLSPVLQLGVTRKTAVPAVIEHLCHHAWTLGATGLFGRLDPCIMPNIRSDMRRFGITLVGGIPAEGDWMLMHARDPEIMNTIHRGEAFISRLEGDMGFL